MQTCIAGSIHSLFSENSADIRRIVDNQPQSLNSEGMTFSCSSLCAQRVEAKALTIIITYRCFFSLASSFSSGNGYIAKVK